MLRHHLQLPYRIALFNRFMRLPETLATAAALVLPVVEYGFEQDSLLDHRIFTPAALALLVILFLRVPCTYFFSSTLKTGFPRCAPETWWSVISLLGFVISLVMPGFVSADGMLRIAVFGFAILRVVHALRVIQRLQIAPLVLFAGTFSTLIAIGAGLLLLPRATQPGVHMEIEDAFFMATSATCVTGLSLYDIGTQFTHFGQMVLLGLIQIGGLGIMTFAAFLSIAFGAGMSVKDRIAMGEMLNFEVVGKISHLIFWILGFTVAIEGLCAALMYGHWVDNAGIPLNASYQLYYSIFHSISAFCNAGFGLHGDNMMRYQGDLPVMLPIGLLIICGGIGFTVVMDLARYRPWHHAFARRLPVIGKRLRRHPLPRLSLQTKIVLLTTLVLLTAPAVIFWVFEQDNPATLGGLPQGAQAWESFFGAGITPRTAGFNSLDYSQMNPITQYFIIMLMFIGASPGSCAGGIKTTSFALLLLVFWNALRGSEEVSIFKRQIPAEQTRKVLVVLVTAMAVVNTAIFVLTWTEPGILATTRGFEKLMFEVVSAFGTVGLSLGATTELSDPGKVVITICMFLGRIGPLTLVFGVAAQKLKKYDYPAESMMLG